MTEQTAQAAVKKTRTKVEGSRGHVVTVDGKEWLLKLEGVRVASAADLNKVVDGEMARAKLVDANANAKPAPVTGGAGGGRTGA